MIGFLNPGLDAGEQVIQVTPVRMIGPFTAQVTIEERHRDEMVITDHPVESGAVISDHAFMLPSSVTIRAGWSESPGGDSDVGSLLDDGGAFDGLSGLTSMTSGEGVGSLRDMYENMRQLQASRIPFEILTGKRIYKNMLIRSMDTLSDKENENSMVLTIECREVQIVTTQVVAVGAPPEAQQEPESTAPVVEKGTKQLADGNKYNATAGEASAAASATGGVTP
jgi:hypothetical protein